MLNYDLDTETTGFSFQKGARIVEIGVVEKMGDVPTGRVFHEFINPGVAVHFKALEVHGLSNKALEHQPEFSAIAGRLVEFVGGHQISAHNAAFDAGFVNGELALAGYAPLKFRDTVPEVSKATGVGKLDQAMRKLGIDVPDRTLHGALLDAAILAAVIARVRGAPDVDVRALVAAGCEGRVIRKVYGRKSGTPGPATPKPGPAGGARIGRPGPGAQERPTGTKRDEGREIFRIVRSAMAEASDIIDLMTRIETAGVRVRPNASGGIAGGKAVGHGHFYGARFRYKSVYATTSALGISPDAFRSGPFVFDAASHATALLLIKERYDEDFGPSDLEKNSELKRSDILPGATTAKPPSAQEPVAAEKEAQAMMARVIADLNLTEPTSDVEVYRGLTMEMRRDRWSRAGKDEIDEEVERICGQRNDAIAALRLLDHSRMLGALRWVCRGLTAEHTLCMVVSRMIERDMDFPEEMRSVAFGKAPEAGM